MAHEASADFRGQTVLGSVGFAAEAAQVLYIVSIYSYNKVTKSSQSLVEMRECHGICY